MSYMDVYRPYVCLSPLSLSGTAVCIVQTRKTATRWLTWVRFIDNVVEEIEQFDEGVVTLPRSPERDNIMEGLCTLLSTNGTLHSYVLRGVSRDTYQFVNMDVNDGAECACMFGEIGENDV